MGSLAELLISKPVLVGLHLGFGILGIDGFLWLLGEVLANPRNRFRMKLAAFIGTLGFLASWIVGGYYYVVHYGTLVKPVILAGAAPWAHTIMMETKEHIFLFLVPMAFTALILSFVSRDEIEVLGLKKGFAILVLTIALIGLAIGAMGYMISASARWG